MRVKILDKYWNLVFETHSADTDGYCDPADKPDKRIQIRPSLKGRDELDTIIHEIHHAADPSQMVDEKWVLQYATDLARVLWDLGYRRDKEISK